MSTEPICRILGPDDPAPVIRSNVRGTAPFLLTGDHAGIAIPACLGTLGLGPKDLARHIACDIGIAALGEALAARLDAAFVHQDYSRLVADCNRDPGSDEAIPEISDGTIIPANAALSLGERQQRIAEIHEPYQKAIGATIAERAARGQPTILIALHSFTPVMGGIARPWDIGVLHNGANDGFARLLLRTLQDQPEINVGDNEPYKMDDTDHSVPRHAFVAGLPYAEIELRQDHLEHAEGRERFAQLLADALSASLIK